MKKKIPLLLLFITTLSLTFVSCLDNDDSKPINYVPLAIDSISMPDSGSFGTNIKITPYLRIKENCQAFQNFGYTLEGPNTRNVIAWGVEENGPSCKDSKTLSVSSFFYFRPNYPGTYTLNFWAGKDVETNEEIVISRQIVITE